MIVFTRYIITQVGACAARLIILFSFLQITTILEIFNWIPCSMRELIVE